MLNSNLKWKLLVSVNRLLHRQKSNKAWLMRERLDPYVRKAHRELYRARSAYKLIEMQEKYNLVKAGDVVFDCGCSPGSWSQVAVKYSNSSESDKTKCKGFVIGVDLLHTQPLEGAFFLTCDIFDPQVHESIDHLTEGKSIDVMLSDISPNICGIRSVDQERSSEIGMRLLLLAARVLKIEGILLFKLFPGKHDVLMEYTKRLFNDVKIIKPLASRKESSEIYVLNRNKKVIT